MDDLLQSRNDTLQQLRRNLEKAQTRMKKLTDEKRRDIEFEVGSWVYVKLKPCRQVPLAGHRPQKLAKRFFGPFQVTEKIGKVAYRLALPPQGKIHPVFHCSLLKPHHGSSPLAIGELPKHVFRVIRWFNQWLSRQRNWILQLTLMFNWSWYNGKAFHLKMQLGHPSVKSNRP